ncbi:hypothetical protein GQ43DRAFT_472677 [Delitschia confertaspora ATCC 74209]|uniref:Uncharacterized protein n=1 Tax=Delitschia confertaspora ATCC 74209 TaxID=1513339 RepID=A0A9P4JJV4_9PLEO|nr:hypothetical protein GQ43DRAFT_472677 [Delitschia confertaspora ATCC 74209]
MQDASFILGRSRPSRLPKHAFTAKHPSKRKRTVSASEIFKQRTAPPTNQRSPLQPVVKPKRVTVNHAGVQKNKGPLDPNVVLKAPKDSRGKKSRSPTKSKSSSNSFSGVHPISAAFNETTYAYREHIYHTATDLLSVAQEELLASLSRVSNIPLPSCPSRSSPEAECTMVSVPYAFKEARKTLTQPLGTAVLKCRQADGEGNTQLEPLMLSLEERMTMFERMLTEEEQEIRRLEGEWERVVGEIVKVGMPVLGEREVGSLLGFHTQEQGHDDEGHEEGQFVLEDDEMTLLNGTLLSKPKKKVAFTQPPPVPAFITSRSIFKHTLPPLPSLPQQQIVEFEKYVDDLGIQELEELEKLAKEEQKGWQDKQVKIMELLQDG